ncbi:MAG: hypothetical protein KKE42_12510 [Alphaproteobacteria bacterium]|uniref:hypothetical protein n=1 Tax=Brevundimonas sp. TaxID=1871086 RepID=UPI00121CCEBE|nr:hypothetical protein [Brevundimonas sp.]MBU3974605.1 hypothetical protein [Alphaproteobacteria bacterium]MBA3050912.1 hypothetical protein [Brevundimonas sp.]MBU4038124.1 hypothetical protein [Alphaproteobacteria bacterium]MBU4135091.1 hypothetical protein [Alphaproteobacteria bacterium]TAJ65251.1 MAG: hypothetical protein EPO49_03395 [Brevundimonas sp.]
MKPLLIAAALLLVPAAAQAQVAAGSLPNSFDAPARPASAAAPVRAAPPAAPAATAPANPRAEEVLREIIAGAQAGSINYALMTDDLAGKVREQETAIQPLISGFGPVQAVDFLGAQNGADLFAVVFSNAATQWVIGFDETDKVAALLFRPAE